MAHFSRNLKAVPPGQLIRAVIDRICTSKPALSIQKKKKASIKLPWIKCELSNIRHPFQIRNSVYMSRGTENS